MRHKNANFKFNKRPLKTLKESNKIKNNFDDFYSKIVLDYFVPDKTKEETKNSNDGNNKLKCVNKIKLSSNSSNRILKISLNENNKFLIKNKNEINNNINQFVKERKTANIDKKILTKKIIQSISEKNIIRMNKNIAKSNTSINSEIYNIKKKKEASNIRLNLNNNNQVQNFQSNINGFINNNKERKNKSMDKRKDIKTKNLGNKKSVNLKININEMIVFKKANYQFKPHNKNNKTDLNRSLNKRNKKIIKINKSPDNLIINENNYMKYNMKEKNINKTKKINTDANSNSKLFNKKKIIKNTDNNSSKNILEKNQKIASLKKNLIDKKNTININLNLSNSKIQNISKHQMTFKRIKVESIKIDLNLMNTQKNYSFISQEKTTAENPVINDKNNLTLRGTELQKYVNKNGYTELNSVSQNELSDLNRSFKTSLSVNKARSLSKKRDEQKRKKLNNLGLIDNDENSKKLNNILISLSNVRVISTKDLEIKSEPKKLIDKIRKFKKLQKM